MMLGNVPFEALPPNQLGNHKSKTQVFLLVIYVIAFLFITTACDFLSIDPTNPTPNNQTPQLLNEQNDLASKFTRDTADFARVYDELQEYIIDAEEDQNVRARLADYEMRLSTELTALENHVERFKETEALLGTRSNLQTESVAGALAFLGVAGLFAGAGKSVHDSYKQCQQLEQEFDESVAEHAIRIIECTVERTPEALADTSKAAVSWLGETVGIAFLPSGKVKVTAELASGSKSTRDIFAFFGQRGCGSQINSQQVEIIPNEVNYYIGSPNEQGVFNDIPEGEWQFVAFSEDHQNTLTSCVIVREGETTQTTITVTPIDEAADQPTSTENQKPKVNAGSDQTISLTDSVSLNGEISDDGLPNPPNALEIKWSKLSGPGNVSFSSTNTTSTSASFSKEGKYILELSADDSRLRASDQVSITVLADSSPPTDSKFEIISYFENDGSGQVELDVSKSTIHLSGISSFPTISWDLKDVISLSVLGFSVSPQLYVWETPSGFESPCFVVNPVSFSSITYGDYSASGITKATEAPNTAPALQKGVFYQVLLSNWSPNDCSGDSSLAVGIVFQIN